MKKPSDTGELLFDDLIKNMMPAVTEYALHGVAVERHQLDVELQRMAHMLRSAGVRVQRAFAQARTGKGEPLKELPAGTLELAEWHSRTLKWLLAEQRARAQLRPGTGLEAITDAQYDAEIRELARETIMDLPDGDLTGLLMEREISRRPR